MTGVYSILGFVAKLGEIERDMHELGPAIVARRAKKRRWAIQDFADASGGKITAEQGNPDAAWAAT
jgi:hypothetical protein